MMGGGGPTSEPLPRYMRPNIELPAPHLPKDRREEFEHLPAARRDRVSDALVRSAAEHPGGHAERQPRNIGEDRKIAAPFVIRAGEGRSPTGDHNQSP